MKWISVEDIKPKEGQKIAFLLDGYEFRGVYQGNNCFHGNQDHLNEDPSIKGVSVTTIKPIEWRPLSPSSQEE